MSSVVLLNVVTTCVMLNFRQRTEHRKIAALQHSLNHSGIAKTTTAYFSQTEREK